MSLMSSVEATPARIYVGVGGWTFGPWRDNFFPKGLPQSQELRFASRQLTSIEINGTYYRTQQPASFAKWRGETPEGFVFSVKASRYATNQKALGQAGESISRFIGSGLSELQEKLGPIVWQFMPTKRFNADEFEAFLQLLPKAVDGLRLRHVMDVRHESFECSEYLKLARRYDVSTVFADSDDYPSFADLTGGFVYARLMRTESHLATGYEPEALDQWASRARQWAAGDEPGDLPRVCNKPQPGTPRDVYLYLISGAKEKAPAAALALLERLR